MGQKEIGCALKCSRKSLRLSVATTSRKLGVSPSTIKRWEAGLCLPSNHELEACLDRMGAPEGSPCRLLLRTPGLRRTDHGGREPNGSPLNRLLRAKRRRNGLTVEEVSSATGISLASLHRYETGERAPDANTLRALASACGCDEAETRLLCDEGSRDGQDFAIDRFITPDAQPHFWLYHRLGRLGGGSAGLAPPPQEVADTVHGFFLMGDHKGALEAWQLLKPVALKCSFTAEQRTLLGLSLTLARMSTSTRAHEVSARAAKWQQSIDDLEPSYSSASAIFHLVRIALQSGELTEAEKWIRRSEQQATDLGDANLMFVCELNWHALTFEQNGSSRVLAILAKLRETARGQLQAYNADVARLGILAKLGSRLELAETLERCRAQEGRFGVGSPLVNRIARFA